MCPIHSVCDATERKIHFHTISTLWPIISRSTKSCQRISNGAIRTTSPSIWWRGAGRRCTNGSIIGRSSKGFIFERGRILEKDLKDEVSVRAGEISTVFADRSNRELVVTVGRMVRDGRMESVIMLPSGQPEWDLTPLVTSFGGMNQDTPQRGTYDVAIYPSRIWEGIEECQEGKEHGGPGAGMQTCLGLR
jgi:hypothetical protein